MSNTKKLSEHTVMRKAFVGTVISAKTPNTVIVAIATEHRHPLYGKAIRKTKHMAAHFEKVTPRVGDTIRIVSTKPISKTKHFIVEEIIKSI